MLTNLQPDLIQVQLVNLEFQLPKILRKDNNYNLIVEEMAKYINRYK